MKIVNDFIQNILLEVCLDSRISSGILEISNPEHIEIIGEHLFEHGMKPQFVMEVVNSLVIRDGKYPDRQAYNKDGWLVTFPSADYRNAAIQKGTHFTSDPTHGKGGMHLYYKKKGKQARVQHQDTSVAGGEATGERPVSPQGQGVETQPPAAGREEKPAADTTTEKPSGAAAASGGSSGGDGGSSDLPPSDDKEAPEPAAPSGGSAPKPSPSTGGAAPDTPAALPVEPLPPPKPSYVELSKKFADQKGWGDTPYQDWHDEVGEKVAVTGLDGQVVPINHADREALKVFIKKNSTQ